ncbi:S10 family peptidase [Terriglobus saanensis]|uniref:Peptidase S10 serine carboxypeptidase n=1 Tax=Terriglobus saanensis (strain ATCC BAA-1853 / DSM 23119 / SP1PR4) TaxID=401053 RepID=E8V2X9_TERSS|nr:peptidase S10 [Terriglobus saanensis]ADV84676.1 peptidase S10 serine carboxypeptidase [Terriglobus saanensis SP1PR4]
MKPSLLALVFIASTASTVFAADKAAAPKVNKPATAADAKPAETASAIKPAPGEVQDSETSGSVNGIAYRAIAGTLTVGSDDGHDAQLDLDGKWLPEAGVKLDKPEDVPATARIFYAAYFKKDADKNTRPVTFLYNGGPGSASMWLHMGSFGPKRVVTTDTQHDAAAPYKIVDNVYSLLDVSDVVFIDAPGTGFSRIFGKDKEKAFWGTDPDAHAFERFIRRFLTKHDRWNSPKYLLGESYGTTRSAVLSNALQNVDLNGVILLSQILSFDNSADGPRWNPGVDYPYELALPTYAATAFYHHKLPSQPAVLEPFLREVEHFALNEYAQALMQGSDLSDADRNAIAEKLHGYTGISTAMILKTDLRMSGGFFSKNEQDDTGTTTGRLDTRFAGPDLSRTSEEAEYDPQSNAISSAYTTAINQYVRGTLNFGKDMTYLPGAYSAPGFTWDLRHGAPGGPPANFSTSVNVMPDLALAMKGNPKMKVFLAGGYYDLATPYFAATYEMHHLPIPRSLAGNISYHFYPSGHMVYVNEEVLHRFHDDVAAFIHSTEAAK